MDRKCCCWCFASYLAALIERHPSRKQNLDLLFSKFEPSLCHQTHLILVLSWATGKSLGWRRAPTDPSRSCASVITRSPRPRLIPRRIAAARWRPARAGDAPGRPKPPPSPGATAASLGSGPGGPGHRSDGCRCHGCSPFWG